MARLLYRCSSLALLCTLFTQGCYMKLNSPQAIAISEYARTSASASKPRISYAISGRGNTIDSAVEKAFLESLSELSVTDVLKSDKYHDDRININVFVFNRVDSAPNIFQFSWALVSLGTLFVVPFYESVDLPYEIHIIRPHAAPGRKTTIIHDHYSYAIWNWLPFYFQKDTTPRNDAEYFTTSMGGPIEEGPVGHTAWRRIFDRLILDLLKEETPGSSARSS